MIYFSENLKIIKYTQYILKQDKYETPRNVKQNRTLRKHYNGRTVLYKLEI